MPATRKTRRPKPNTYGLRHISLLALCFVLVVACRAEPASTTRPDPVPANQGANAPVNPSRDKGLDPKVETQDATAPSPVVALPKATLGAEAPDFKLPDLDQKQHQLSSYRGKTVVLEWYNPDCPFVVAAHTKGTLRSMAKDQDPENVVWLAINSSAPQRQGHGEARNRQSVRQYKLDHPILIDEDGRVGRAFDARTTPHMFVIDAEGVLVYRGALDNAPLGKADQPYVPYLQQALDDLAAKQPVRVSETQAWGCSVKYGPKIP